MVNSRFRKTQSLSLFYYYTHGFFVQGFASRLAKDKQENSRMSQGVMIHLYQNLKVKSTLISKSLIIINIYNFNKIKIE